MNGRHVDLSTMITMQYKDVKFCCIECVRDTEAEDREAMAAAPTRAETLVANNV